MTSWPWLVQIGYKRAGRYSYDSIHRAMGIAGSPDDDLFTALYLRVMELAD